MKSLQIKKHLLLSLLILVTTQAITSASLSTSQNSVPSKQVTEKQQAYQDPLVTALAMSLAVGSMIAFPAARALIKNPVHTNKVIRIMGTTGITAAALLVLYSEYRKDTLTF
jgi:hypothetical protein